MSVYVLGSGTEVGTKVGTGFDANVPAPAAAKLSKKPFAPMARLGTIDENIRPNSRSAELEKVRKSELKVTIPARLEALKLPLPPEPLKVKGVKSASSRIVLLPSPSLAGMSRVIVITAEFTPLPLKMLSKPVPDTVGPSVVNEVNVRCALCSPDRSAGRSAMPTYSKNIGMLVALMEALPPDPAVPLAV